MTKYGRLGKQKHFSYCVFTETRGGCSNGLKIVTIKDYNMIDF